MQSTELSPALIFRLLFQPRAVFDELSTTRPSAHAVFFRLAIWIGIVPPIFAFVGASLFGWRLGAVEPIFFSTGVLFAISVAYFLTLLFGFISSAVVSQWMASTYGARHSLGIHFAMITVVGTPLAVGSVIHLYPHVFINILVLVPTLIWSMYLLYRGLPVVLQTSPERGMLMASSLIGYLLVAAVSLLGVTVVLWGQGIGPRVGI
ncbi:MAG: Yip1 family protein [Gammaproteobacteria bacterium]